MRDYDYSKIGVVEDYTDAFLVCAWVLLFIALVTMAVMVGFVPTLLVGYLAARWLNGVHAARRRVTRPDRQ